MTTPADASAALAPDAHAHANQFALLRQRRFAPFFWTQFAGAANDNLFKFAFTVMVTYQLQLSWMPPAMAGLVIGALFILPFLLFSATGGPAHRQVRQDEDDPLRQEPRDRDHGDRGLGLHARPMPWCCWAACS